MADRVDFRWEEHAGGGSAYVLIDDRWLCVWSTTPGNVGESIPDGPAFQSIADLLATFAMPPRIPGPPEVVLTIPLDDDDVQEFAVGNPDPTPDHHRIGDYCRVEVGDLVSTDQYGREWYCTWHADQNHTQHVAGYRGRVVAVRDDSEIDEAERRWTAERRAIQQAMDNGTYDPGMPTSAS